MPSLLELNRGKDNDMLDFRLQRSYLLRSRWKEHYSKGFRVYCSSSGVTVEVPIACIRSNLKLTVRN